MVTRSHHFEATPLSLLPPLRSQPWRSARSRNCEDFQNRQDEIQPACEGVDEQIRYVTRWRKGSGRALILNDYGGAIESNTPDWKKNLCALYKHFIFLSNSLSLYLRNIMSFFQSLRKYRIKFLTVSTVQNSTNVVGKGSEEGIISPMCFVSPLVLWVRGRAMRVFFCNRRRDFFFKKKKSLQKSLQNDCSQKFYYFQLECSQSECIMFCVTLPFLFPVKKPAPLFWRYVS